MTAARVIDAYLAPAIVGEDPTAPERLGLRLRAAVQATLFARAGVEMALWDLAGKAAGLPLNRLLGGPVRPHVRTKFSVSGVAPDEAAEIASWAVAQGFDAMKVKVGLGLAADLARVAAVRAAIGDDVLLGVDANGGWSRAEARAALRPLHELGVAFVEQPLAPRELAAWPSCGARPSCRSSPTSPSEHPRTRSRSCAPRPPTCSRSTSAWPEGSPARAASQRSPRPRASAGRSAATSSSASASPRTCTSQPRCRRSPTISFRAT